MSKDVDILEHRRKNSQSVTNIICVIVLIRFVDFWLKTKKNLGTVSTAFCLELKPMVRS